MKSFLPVFFIAFLGINTSGQTILLHENFESAPVFTLNSTDLSGTTTGINPWVINNVYAGGPGSFMCMGFPIPFTVPAAPTQPAGITNNPTSMHLHIASQIAIDGGGTLPASSYVVADGFCIFGGQSTFAKMSSDVSTVGHDSVTLDFWWMCGGSTAYYGEVYYSTDGGTTWAIVNNPISGTALWNGQTNWVSSEVTNSNWANQATLRFGFRFLSPAAGVGAELDPGFSIDDLTITGHDIVPPGCTNTTSTINATACNSYVSPSGLYTWTSSDTYMDTIPNTAGCDSIITANITINSVDATAAQTGHTLTANQSGAVYQWLDCNNSYAIISGATSQNYTATANGNYAVSVTNNGCTDTSSCFTISDVGLDNENQNQIAIYPNPANDFVTISTGNLISGQLIITDVLGREIYRTNLISNSTVIPLHNLSDGNYVVTVLSEDGNTITVEKLVKE